MLKLIVKSNLYGAVSAAATHGIEAVEAKVGPAVGQTMLLIDSSLLEKAQRWFNESNGKAPFPEGSCLFFSEATGRTRL